MRIVFMGTPEYAIPPLEYLVLNHHEVVAVYTRPDKPAGRGLQPVSPPVKNAALSLGIPVFQTASFKNPETVEQLKNFRPEAIVVAAFGQILPQSVLEIPCYGCLNIHPSLLPKYRGPSPVPAAILAGDDFIGVSVMQLDAGMDSGPVFTRAQVSVLDHDTTATLLPKLFRIGAWMLLEVLVALPAGKILPEPQDHAMATVTHEITREQGLIDWKLSAVEIWRRIRAYQPWPEAYTYWQGKQLKILEAVPLTGSPGTESGRVVEIAPAGGNLPDGFGVGTGSGILKVLKVQLQGKRAMTAAEFLRGQRGFIGSLLG
ncbi:MAG: methionyl-tRNA formyltransferase [Dehalococcoidales bacterium]|nr:methionyl-tRNA formyltransferase [Dehalococcoidales bacterium]